MLAEKIEWRKYKIYMKLYFGHQMYIFTSQTSLDCLPNFPEYSIKENDHLDANFDEL